MACTLALARGPRGHKDEVFLAIGVEPSTMPPWDVSDTRLYCTSRPPTQVGHHQLRVSSQGTLEWKAPPLGL